MKYCHFFIGVRDSIKSPVNILPSRRFLAALIAIAAMGSAVAQPYPNRPVHLVVTYPPGGITDVLARTIAQRISIDWGQQMVVDNRAGASGNIGMGSFAIEASDK